MKGAHYSFLVQGDRVKPDSILLVVLSCDKATGIVAALSDVIEAQRSTQDSRDGSNRDMST